MLSSQLLSYVLNINRELSPPFFSVLSLSYTNTNSMKARTCLPSTPPSPPTPSITRPRQHPSTSNTDNNTTGNREAASPHHCSSPACPGHRRHVTRMTTTTTGALGGVSSLGPVRGCRAGGGWRPGGRSRTRWRVVGGRRRCLCVGVLSFRGPSVRGARRRGVSGLKGFLFWTPDLVDPILQYLFANKCDFRVVSFVSHDGFMM